MNGLLWFITGAIAAWILCISNEFRNLYYRWKDALDSDDGMREVWRLSRLVQSPVSQIQIQKYLKEMPRTPEAIEKCKTRINQILAHQKESSCR